MYRIRSIFLLAVCLPIIHAANKPSTVLLAEPRGAIGIIDAAAVAVAAGVNLNLEVPDIAHLANAACECIMSDIQNFTLTSDDLANRLGEVAWSLQISQR